MLKIKAAVQIKIVLEAVGSRVLYSRVGLLGGTKLKSFTCCLSLPKWLDGCFGVGRHKPADLILFVLPGNRMSHSSHFALKSHARP